MPVLGKGINSLGKKISNFLTNGNGETSGNHEATTSKYVKKLNENRIKIESQLSNLKKVAGSRHIATGTERYFDRSPPPSYYLPSGPSCPPFSANDLPSYDPNRPGSSLEAQLPTSDAQSIIPCVPYHALPSFDPNRAGSSLEAQCPPSHADSVIPCHHYRALPSYDPNLPGSSLEAQRPASHAQSVKPCHRYRALPSYNPNLPGSSLEAQRPTSHAQSVKPSHPYRALPSYNANLPGSSLEAQRPTSHAHSVKPSHPYRALPSYDANPARIHDSAQGGPFVRKRTERVGTSSRAQYSDWGRCSRCSLPKPARNPSHPSSSLDTQRPASRVRSVKPTGLSCDLPSFNSKLGSNDGKKSVKVKVGLPHPPNSTLENPRPIYYHESTVLSCSSCNLPYDQPNLDPKKIEAEGSKTQLQGSPLGGGRSNPTSPYSAIKTSRRSCDLPSLDPNRPVSTSDAKRPKTGGMSVLAKTCQIIKSKLRGASEGECINSDPCASTPDPCVQSVNTPPIPVYPSLHSYNFNSPNTTVKTKRSICHAVSKCSSSELTGPQLNPSASYTQRLVEYPESPRTFYNPKPPPAKPRSCLDSPPCSSCDMPIEPYPYPSRTSGNQTGGSPCQSCDLIPPVSSLLSSTSSLESKCSTSGIQSSQTYCADGRKSLDMSRTCSKTSGTTKRCCLPSCLCPPRPSKETNMVQIYADNLEKLQKGLGYIGTDKRNYEQKANERFEKTLQDLENRVVDTEIKTAQSIEKYNANVQKKRIEERKKCLKKVRRINKKRSDERRRYMTKSCLEQNRGVRKQLSVEDKCVKEKQGLEKQVARIGCRIEKAKRAIRKKLRNAILGRERRIRRAADRAAKEAAREAERYTKADQRARAELKIERLKSRHARKSRRSSRKVKRIRHRAYRRLSRRRRKIRRFFRNPRNLCFRCVLCSICTVIILGCMGFCIPYLAMTHPMVDPSLVS